MILIHFLAKNTLNYNRYHKYKQLLNIVLINSLKAT